MSGDAVYVQHILEAIESIEQYLDGVERAEFEGRKLLIDGVIRELEIIGEAATHLSERFRAKHPEVPFVDIIAMRNQLIHEYFGVDIDVVWKTVTDDLPVLKKQLESLV